MALLRPGIIDPTFIFLLTLPLRIDYSVRAVQVGMQGHCNEAWHARHNLEPFSHRMDELLLVFLRWKRPELNEGHG